jgi:predicted Zn-dependent peptidase
VQFEQLDERLVRCVAPNGLRVLAEQLPGVRSTAIGIWVRSGSAHEVPTQMGTAHLLEHLVFKGSERRTAREIAWELESRGGSLDAYTSRDHTNFQAHILDTDLPVAVDVLTDLVRRPLLTEDDLRMEKNVVLEEIRGVEDNPEELVHDLHARTLWGSHPYGHAILGSRDTVTALTAADLRDFHTSRYVPQNCVIAAAGSITTEALVSHLEAEGWFDAAGGEKAHPLPHALQDARRGVRESVHRGGQQHHIVFGTDTVPASDSRRYALGLIVTLFGGGMSSRLFQKVREELGLAYAVYAYQQFYQAAGILGVYVGTQPETADLAVSAILTEYERLAEEGIPEAELITAKQQLKGQIVLSLESPGSRMGRLAGMELTGDRYRRIDEVLAEIDAVTGDSVREIAREFLAPDRQTVLRLGPTDHHRTYEETRT